MQALFENGTIVDIALIIVMAEILGFALWRFTRGGPSLLASLPFLASGGFLLIALRTTLSGGQSDHSLVALALSGICHAGDLMVRFGRRIRG